MRCRTVSVPDFTDFIEFACEEADATNRSYPSIADVARAAPKLIPRCDQPRDTRNISQGEQSVMWGWLTVYERYRRQSFGVWHHLSKCPYCKVTLDIQTIERPGGLMRSFDVRTCSQCGWWDTEQYLEEDQWPVEGQDKICCSVKSSHKRAILKQFSITAIDVPVASLRNHLATHFDRVTDISPRKMEELVSDIFADHLDCEVKHVGGPGDGGIDLLLIRGDVESAIQVKRRANITKSEPVSSIREFLGAMLLGGHRRGIFVSTAAKFSPPAIDAATKATTSGIVEFIELRNAEDIHRMCVSTSKNRPVWEECLTEPVGLSRATEPGRDEFLSYLVGDPGWRVGPGNERSNEQVSRSAQLLAMDIPPTDFAA
jgi:restriction system protein